MSTLLSLIAPLIMCAVCLCGVWRGVDVYSALAEGAKKGLRTALDILPALMVLFPAIYLLRASGLPERLSGAIAPVLGFLGIPEDTALLMLLRPVSGSASLSAAAELIERCGPDSLTGRTAAVMIGSSETTLYVVAVYFGAAGIKDSRWAVPAALIADFTCFVASAWICRYIWG